MIAEIRKWCHNIQEAHIPILDDFHKEEHRFTIDEQIHSRQLIIQTNIILMALIRIKQLMKE